MSAGIAGVVQRSTPLEPASDLFLMFNCPPLRPKHPTHSILSDKCIKKGKKRYAKDYPHAAGALSMPVRCP